MKLTAILLTVFFLQVKADGLSQTVTFSGENVSLKKVITAIKQQTGYSFFYTMDIWKEAKPVTIDVKNATVDEVMKLVMKQQPFTYIIENKTIIISKKKEGKTDEGQIIKDFNPPIDVKGRVINENGEPVAAASVFVKGSNIGTTTNDNGEFFLSHLDENAVMVISGVNINTIEIKVDGHTYLSINVKSLVTPLEETVIKGYYSTSKTKYRKC